MSKSTKNIVKFSSLLGVVLGLSVLGMTKASALEIPIPFGLEQLTQRGVKLGVEPTLRLFDKSVNSNQLQLCILPCKVDAPTDAISSPQTPALQPQLKDVLPETPVSQENSPATEAPSQRQ
jgi:hypothetical protein